MAILSIPAAEQPTPVIQGQQMQGRDVPTTADVLVQTIDKPTYTLLATITLGNSASTGTLPATTDAAPANKNGGISQEALGGVIGAVVGIIIIVLIGWVCCGRVRMPPKYSAYGSSRGGSRGSRSRSSRTSSSSTSSSSSQSSGTGSEMVEDQYAAGLGPGDPPMPGPPPAMWRGPQSGPAFPMGRVPSGPPPNMPMGTGGPPGFRRGPPPMPP